MSKRGGWEPTGFGEKLKALREKAGLTLAQLGEIAGCHWNTLAKMERGQQEPAWPLVLSLCQALGVDCSAFTQIAASDPVTTTAPEPLPATGAEPGKRKRKKSDTRSLSEK